MRPDREQALRDRRTTGARADSGNFRPLSTLSVTFSSPVTTCSGHDLPEVCSMRKLLCGVLWVGLPTVVAGVGCGGAPSTPTSTNEPQAKTPMVSVADGCERKSPGVGAARYGEQREGSAVALAKSGESVIAYVADEDSRAIHTVNVADKTQVARTKVGGAPAQVLVLADGRLAVTLRDKNEIEILEPKA